MKASTRYFRMIVSPGRGASSGMVSQPHVPSTSASRASRCLASCRVRYWSRIRASVHEARPARFVYWVNITRHPAARAWPRKLAIGGMMPVSRASRTLNGCV